MLKSKNTNKWLALAEEMGFTKDKNTSEYPIKDFIAEYPKEYLYRKIGGREGIKGYMKARYYKKYNDIEYFALGLLGHFFSPELFELKFEAIEKDPKDWIARFSIYRGINREALYPLIENKLLHRETTHPVVFEQCLSLFFNTIYYPSIEEEPKFITYNPALAKVLYQLQDENYRTPCNLESLIYWYERFNKEKRYFYRAISKTQLYPNTIEDIYRFIQGYGYALSHFTEFSGEKDLEYQDFGEAGLFFQYTLNPKHIDIGATNIFRYFTDSDEAAIDLFYELLEKYKNRSPDTLSNYIRKTLIEAYNSGQRLFETWDFEQTNLDNLDLSGCTFHSWFGCNMKNCNLENTKFIRCNLKCTNMAGSNLKNATIEECSLEGLSLFDTNTEGITFKNNSCYGSGELGIEHLEHFKNYK